MTPCSAVSPSGPVIRIILSYRSMPGDLVPVGTAAAEVYTAEHEPLLVVAL
jgi:hypothetical protein